MCVFFFLFSLFFFCPALTMKKPLFRMLREICVATLCLGILVYCGIWNIAVSSFRGEFKKQRSSMIKVECFVSFLIIWSLSPSLCVSFTVCLSF